MKTKRRWLILAGVVVAVGLLAIFGLNRGPQAEHFAAKVERGEIKDVVEATNNQLSHHRPSGITGFRNDRKT